MVWDSWAEAMSAGQWGSFFWPGNGTTGLVWLLCLYICFLLTAYTWGLTVSVEGKAICTMPNHVWALKHGTLGQCECSVPHFHICKARSECNTTIMTNHKNNNNNNNKFRKVCGFWFHHNCESTLERRRIWFSHQWITVDCFIDKQLIFFFIWIEPSNVVTYVSAGQRRGRDWGHLFFNTVQNNWPWCEHSSKIN